MDPRALAAFLVALSVSRAMNSYALVSGIWASDICLSLPARVSFHYVGVHACWLIPVQFSHLRLALRASAYPV